MLRRILNRIRSYEQSLSSHNEDSIDDLEFEKILLSEIEYLQENYEETLSVEILEKEKDLIEVLSKLKIIAERHNIDQNALRNIILTEFNQMILNNNIL